MPTRACTAITKNGKPCKATPLGDSDICLAHADKATKSRIAPHFGGPTPGAGRKRHPSALEVLRERIEAAQDVVLDPLWEALEAEQSLVVGTGPAAHLESVADHRTRIAAARELLDRGFGKPKQQTEITTPDGPVLIAPVDATDKARRAALLLQDRGLLPPASPNGNGNGHA